MNLSHLNISIIGTHPEDPKVRENEDSVISQTIVEAIERIKSAAAKIFVIDGMPVSRARVYATGKLKAVTLTVSFPLGSQELSRTLTLPEFEALAADDYKAE